MPFSLVSKQVPLIYCSKQPGKLLFFQKAVTIRTIDLAQNITRNWEAYGWDQLNIEAIALPHLRLEVVYKKGLYYREFMVYVAVKTIKDFYLSTYIWFIQFLSWVWAEVLTCTIVIEVRNANILPGLSAQIIWYTSMWSATACVIMDLLIIT